jgi:hypothetical protein
MVHYIHLRKIWKVHSLKIMKSFARPYYFTERGRLCPYDRFNPTTFCVCTKSGSWAVIYIRAGCIDLTSVPTMFLSHFGTSRQCGIFLSSFDHLWVWIMIKKNEDYLTKFTSQFMFSGGIPLVSSVINEIY